MPSGPNPPSQEAPKGEMIVYGEPSASDPYYESQESSDIPENLRYPERSFRPPPLNNKLCESIGKSLKSHFMLNTCLLNEWQIWVIK